MSAWPAFPCDRQVKRVSGPFLPLGKPRGAVTLFCAGERRFMNGKRRNPFRVIPPIRIVSPYYFEIPPKMGDAQSRFASYYHHVSTNPLQACWRQRWASLNEASGCSESRRCGEASWPWSRPSTGRSLSVPLCDIRGDMLAPFYYACRAPSFSIRQDLIFSVRP